MKAYQLTAAFCQGFLAKRLSEGTHHCHHRKLTPVFSFSLLSPRGIVLSHFDIHHNQMDCSGGKDTEAKPTGNEKMELPVLTQPGLGVTTTTVTTITQTGGDWSTGLFDVCSDAKTFMMGAFVPCCLDLSLAHQYGECMCLPLLPGSTFAMRVGIRERFKIRGSVCEDWTTVYCCYPLAICQMIREMKKRLKTQIYTVSTALESS